MTKRFCLTCGHDGNCQACGYECLHARTLAERLHNACREIRDVALAIGLTPDEILVLITSMIRKDV